MTDDPGELLRKEKERSATLLAALKKYGVHKQGRGWKAPDLQEWSECNTYDEHPGEHICDCGLAEALLRLPRTMQDVDAT